MSSNTIASDELGTLIERVERIETEQKELATDKREVYQEAKARGFDPRQMREIVRLRKLDAVVRREREALRSTYKIAMGLLDD